MKHKYLTIKFRSASLDIVTDEDGIIDSVNHNGTEISSLLFDLHLNGELQTVVTQELMERAFESVKLSKESES